MAIARTHILVCGGTGCSSSHSQALIDELNRELEEKGLLGEVQVIKTGCFGLCALGPVVVVYPEGCFYSHVTEADIPEIVEEHILKGRIVTRLLYQETVVDDKTIKNLNHTKFYEKQHRVALRNCGVINPENIDEYIAMDGYEALGRVLTGMTPDEVIQTIKDSGLRGRGGGGFPTGQKWFFARQSKGDVKYVCCNADEGDPGAFMDRSVLEGDPHVVLEAMTIAGYAIGAHQGYIYVRAEYPIAIHRLQIAIKQAREYGFLGDDIFGTGFAFDIELRLGSGAFVCGEETALMTSIEGHRGEPRPRPPFPAVKGLFGVPTILNNVETWANIPRIILNGADWFASMGTERSKGTKVFCLVGKINNTGLVEIPMGTTLREIVEDIGGGIPNGKKFKAAQTGGPSGGCIPASLIDTPIDYDNLIAIGSMMGSGGLIVMDEDTCMVDIASWNLPWTRAAASARPAVWAPGACWRCWSRSRPATAPWSYCARWRSCATTSRPTACARWDSLPPTPCFPPCIISVTSTRHTASKNAAPPAFASGWCGSSSRRTSARAAPPAPVPAPSMRSPAR